MGFTGSPGAAVFGGLVAAVQRCMDIDAVPRDDSKPVAGSLWLALHGLVALRRTKPGFPWPPSRRPRQALRRLAAIDGQPDFSG
jgi:hypothetical protein